MVFLQELFVSCFLPSNSLQNPAFPDPTSNKKKDRLSPCFSQQCKPILFYCDVNSFKGLKCQSIFLPHRYCITAFAAYLCSVSQKKISTSVILLKPATQQRQEPLKITFHNSFLFEYSEYSAKSPTVKHVERRFLRTGRNRLHTAWNGAAPKELVTIVFRRLILVCYCKKRTVQQWISFDLTAFSKKRPFLYYLKDSILKCGFILHKR
jgi:hypothetical protein